MKKFKNIIIKILVIITILPFVQSCTDDLAKEIYELRFQQYLRPINVSFGVVGLNSIDVSWMGSAPLFEVEYSQVADFSGDIGKVTVSERECTLSALEENRRYYVRVRAVSGGDFPKASEYSDVVNISTLAEPSIENIVAVAEMEYTLDPLVVTTIVTITWGTEGVDPEAITSITFTATGGSPVSYDVTPEEAAQQKKIINSGLEPSTEYVVRLHRSGKERGSCLVLTEDGPIPTVSGTSTLDYETTPVSAKIALTWELYGIVTINNVSFTKSGSDTPFLTVPVSAEELNSESKEVTGLEAGTTYIVKLLNNEDPVAQTEITTPDAPTSNMTVVRPEDGDLFGFITDADRTDTLYLTPGNHTLTASTNCFIKKNLVLLGENKAITTVNMTGYMSPVGDFDRLVLKNITFSTATFLLRTTIDKASNTFNLGRYEINDCNLKAADVAGCLYILARTAGFKGSIGTCHFQNVTVYSLPANSHSAFVQVSSSDPYMSFSNIEIINCTASNNGRGLVVTGQVDEPVNITVRNSTFYNMCMAKYILFYPYTTKNMTLNISNSIFHFGSTDYRFLGYVAATSEVNITNSYFFKGQTPLFNGAVVAGNNGMTEYDGTPETLFENPGANPFDSGVSFRINDSSMRDKNIGDPRW